MTYAFSPPRRLLPFSPMILVKATRCWSDALCNGRAVQPSLYRLLNPYHIQILTPVLDSLLRFYQDALGRSLAIGTASRMTADELQLIELVEGSLDSRACLFRSLSAASGLDRAISSTRIMMSLVARD